MTLSSKRLLQLKDFEDKIGYTFNDKKLIDVAFTHSSYTNEAKSDAKSNERLEFLGDSILDMVVSEVLFKNYQRKPEGWLTKTRSRLVCTDSFAKASEKFDLTSYLNFGQGEKKHGGQLKKHVKADTFEAVCAAIYLDASYDFLFKFLTSNYKDEALEIIEDDSIFNDYKTRLQEYYNVHGKKILVYNLENQVGPEHDKVFTMSVRAGNRVLATGTGKNKKKAEQDAAKNAYERIKK
ncbi:ribonuclease III [uncultured Anaerococcus sp.]|uniref:ribonuclease III n=1 Tax=uncultured Anaerococcus sp. TaxID=293428 RepID=UPI00261B8230|nr:ribonuclease III [uncultured Anaerococcus sp.]